MGDETDIRRSRRGSLWGRASAQEGQQDSLHLQRAAGDLDQVAVQGDPRGALLVCVLVHTPAQGPPSLVGAVSIRVIKQESRVEETGLALVHQDRMTGCSRPRQCLLVETSVSAYQCCVKRFRKNDQYVSKTQWQQQRKCGPYTHAHQQTTAAGGDGRPTRPDVQAGNACCGYHGQHRSHDAVRGNPHAATAGKPSTRPPALCLELLIDGRYRRMK